MTNIKSESVLENYPRGNVPDTQRLQKNILAVTQGMPQSPAQTVPQTAKIFNFVRQPMMVGMAASIAAVAVVFSFWSPQMSTEPSANIVDNKVIVTEDNPSLTELSLDELEFHELMLLQDELVFAQL